jgi:hypothetical protein
VVWTRIESIIWSLSTSKSNRLSLSLFTVNQVALVADPYPANSCLFSSQTRIAAAQANPTSEHSRVSIDSARTSLPCASEGATLLPMGARAASVLLATP